MWCLKGRCVALIICTVLASTAQAYLPLSWLETCHEANDPRFMKVSLSYQSYDDQARSHELWVPIVAAKSLQTIFADIQFQGLRIANILNISEMPYGFQHGLFDNVTTGAVCLDMMGTERYLLFINPAQNPMLALHIPCEENKPYCTVDIFPATAALAVNRNLRYRGVLDPFVPFLEQHGLEYYQMPTDVLVSWSTVAVPLW